MSEPNAEEAYSALPRSARLAAIIIGLLLVTLGGALFFRPPNRKAKEISVSTNMAEVSTAKQSETDSDPSTVVIAILTAGVALTVYGLNGLRMTKLSSPIGDAEAMPAKVTPAAKQGPQVVPPDAQQHQAFVLQVFRYFLSMSSWNGLKVCEMCRLAWGTQSKQFNLRAVCLTDTRMTFDYAYAYLVATSSFGVFNHSADVNGIVILITAFNPAFFPELDAELARRVAADPGDAELKGIELAAIRKHFVVA